MSQKTKVKNRILEVGYVDNFWAIENYILRLGAIVFKLRAEGLNLVGAFGKEIGKEKVYWKNYYYTQKRIASVSKSEVALQPTQGQKYQGQEYREDCAMCFAQKEGAFVPPHTHEPVSIQRKLI